MMLQIADSTQAKLATALLEGQFAIAVATISAVVALLSVYLTHRLSTKLEQQKLEGERALLDVKRRHDAELLDIRKKHDEEILVFRTKLERQELNFREAGPARTQLIQHMVRTKELVESTFTKFADFARSSSTLDAAEVLPRATDTLDLYADLREHLKHHFVESSYPAQLVDSIRRGQGHLASIFLDLQFAATSHGDPRNAEERVGEALLNLLLEKQRALQIVHSYAAVELPAPPAAQ